MITEWYEYEMLKLISRDEIEPQMSQHIVPMGNLISDGLIDWPPIMMPITGANQMAQKRHYVQSLKRLMLVMHLT